MTLDTVWTSPVRTIGKHEWRIHQYLHAQYGTMITYEWRGPNAPSYQPSERWNDQEQWPTYNSDNGATAGLPVSLRDLYDTHYEKLQSNKTRAHAGHIITEAMNANGLTKFTVCEIGESKPRGQMLTLEKAKALAEQYAPQTKLGAPSYGTELTPTGEQAVIPGCERNASPKIRQLDLFGGVMS